MVYIALHRLYIGDGKRSVLEAFSLHRAYGMAHNGTQVARKREKRAQTRCFAAIWAGG